MLNIYIYIIVKSKIILLRYMRIYFFHAFQMQIKSNENT